MTTSQTNLYHLTIREASALLKSGQLSPVELTQSFLDRIEATDDRLHSFIIVLKEQALDDARLAEAEIRRGDYKGPLHGIPFALKDLYDTAGITTTSGSKVDIDRVPTEDATTTARLKAAGGILLGKLAMHEFALGGPDFTTPFPPARNPWNLAHITGGSSSGSGAAVLRVRRWPHWVPAPVGRFAVRHPCAASSASRQPMAGSAGREWLPSVGPKTTAVP